MLSNSIVNYSHLKDKLTTSGKESHIFHLILIYYIPAIESNSLFSNCTLKAKTKKDHINYSPNCRISQNSNGRQKEKAIQT